MSVVHDPAALANAQQALNARGEQLAAQAADLGKRLQDTIDQTAALAAELHADAFRINAEQAALIRDASALDITAPDVVDAVLRTLDRPAQTLFHASRRGARDAARGIGEAASQTVPLPQRNTSTYAR